MLDQTSTPPDRGFQAIPPAAWFGTILICAMGAALALFAIESITASDGPMPVVIAVPAVALGAVLVMFGLYGLSKLIRGALHMTSINAPPGKFALLLAHALRKLVPASK